MRTENAKANQTEATERAEANMAAIQTMGTQRKGNSLFRGAEIRITSRGGKNSFNPRYDIHLNEIYVYMIHGRFYQINM